MGEFLEVQKLIRSDSLRNQSRKSYNTKQKWKKATSEKRAVLPKSLESSNSENIVTELEEVLAIGHPQDN